MVFYAFSKTVIRNNFQKQKPNITILFCDGEVPLTLISCNKELDEEVRFVNFAHPYKQREDQFIYVYHYKSGTSIKYQNQRLRLIPLLNSGSYSIIK